MPLPSEIHVTAFINRWMHHGHFRDSSPFIVQPYLKIKTKIGPNPLNLWSEVDDLNLNLNNCVRDFQTPPTKGIVASNRPLQSLFSQTYNHSVFVRLRVFTSRHKSPDWDSILSTSIQHCLPQQRTQNSCDPLTMH